MKGKKESRLLVRAPHFCFHSTEFSFLSFEDDYVVVFVVFYRDRMRKQTSGSVEKEGKQPPDTHKKNENTSPSLQIFPRDFACLRVPEGGESALCDKQVSARGARVDLGRELVLAADKEGQRKDRGEAHDLREREREERRKKGETRELSSFFLMSRLPISYRHRREDREDVRLRGDGVLCEGEGEERDKRFES